MATAWGHFNFRFRYVGDGIIKVCVRVGAKPTSRIAFHCPYTTRFFSATLTQFNLVNSFATAKLLNLENQDDHDDETWVSRPPEAYFSDDVAVRANKLNIGVRIPGLYRILISPSREDECPALEISAYLSVINFLYERIRLGGWSNQIVMTRTVPWGLCKDPAIKVPGAMRLAGLMTLQKL